eukprot:7233525-Prymnesium_polylepis.1
MFEGRPPYHEKLEAGTLRRLVPARHGCVVVERLVVHPQIHAAIGKCWHAKDAAAAAVERAGLTVDA